jgi:hypothetical protein
MSFGVGEDALVYALEDQLAAVASLDEVRVVDIPRAKRLSTLGVGLELGCDV